MNFALKSVKPRVCRRDGQVVVDIHREDAEELQIHLRSHGIDSVAQYDQSDGAAHLVIVDLGFAEIQAVLGQWEVAKG